MLYYGWSPILHVAFSRVGHFKLGRNPFSFVQRDSVHNSQHFFFDHRSTELAIWILARSFSFVPNLFWVGLSSTSFWRLVKERRHIFKQGLPSSDCHKTRQEMFARGTDVFELHIIQRQRTPTATQTKETQDKSNVNGDFKFWFVWDIPFSGSRLSERLT